MFCSPGHIAFTILNFDIHWYGIFMSTSILCALFVIIFVKNKYFKEISTDNICDLSFFLILFGLFSARIYYVLLDYQYFMKHPYEIFAIWNGGISIQGAILGGVVAGYIYAKEHNLNFFRYADLFSFGIVVGQIIGRWGNFFNSEAFGLPTQLPWKLYIPYALRPLEYKNYEFFHPAFLYESILNIFVFLILYFVLIKYKKRKDGFIFFLYIILYSVVRLCVETIRLDSVLTIHNIHIAHIAALLLIFFASLGLYKISRN